MAAQTLGCSGTADRLAELRARFKAAPAPAKKRKPAKSAPEKAKKKQKTPSPFGTSAPPLYPLVSDLPAAKPAAKPAAPAPAKKRPEEVPAKPAAKPAAPAPAKKRKPAKSASKKAKKQKTKTETTPEQRLRKVQRVVAAFDGGEQALAQKSVSALGRFLAKEGVAAGRQDVRNYVRRGGGNFAKVLDAIGDIGDETSCDEIRRDAKRAWKVSAVSDPKAEKAKEERLESTMEAAKFLGCRGPATPIGLADFFVPLFDGMLPTHAVQAYIADGKGCFRLVLNAFRDGARSLDLLRAALPARTKAAQKQTREKAERERVKAEKRAKKEAEKPAQEERERVKAEKRAKKLAEREAEKLAVQEWLEQEPARKAAEAEEWATLVEQYKWAKKDERERVKAEKRAKKLAEREAEKLAAQEWLEQEPARKAAEAEEWATLVEQYLERMEKAPTLRLFETHRQAAIKCLSFAKECIEGAEGCPEASARVYAAVAIAEQAVASRVDGLRGGRLGAGASAAGEKKKDGRKSAEWHLRYSRREVGRCGSPVAGEAAPLAHYREAACKEYQSLAAYLKPIVDREGAVDSADVKARVERCNAALRQPKNAAKKYIFDQLKAEDAEMLEGVEPQNRAPLSPSVHLKLALPAVRPLGTHHSILRYFPTDDTRGRPVCAA